MIEDQDHPSDRKTNFTPLDTPLDQVLMQIKDDVALTNKLKSNPNKRPKNKYYHFHRDHGHDTSKCYDLKQQIETLIKQGKLQQFVRGRENQPRDPKPNRRVEERPKALLEEIRGIVRESKLAGSSKKVRKTYLRMV